MVKARWGWGGGGGWRKDCGEEVLWRGGGDGITLLEQSLDDNYTWFMVVETD